MADAEELISGLGLGLTLPWPH